MRAIATISALFIALALAACGTEKADITPAEAELNKVLGGAAKVDCPKEVEDKEGTKFDCTVKGEGKEVTVPMTLSKEGGKLAVNPQDPAQFQRAVQQALGL